MNIKPYNANIAGTKILDSEASTIRHDKNAEPCTFGLPVEISSNKKPILENFIE